jgi:N-acetylglucosamine kinase-like BadF-type ATPase
MGPYFLGVDGGQSSTTALVGDATGRIAGFGRGGPCNHVGASEARAKFLATIGGCVQQACGQAGLDRAEFESACLGFSGGPQDKEGLVGELLSANRLLVTDDGLVALVGACGGEPGLITIGGTGSIAYGRSADGRMARAGGWGYIFGDEGGAFDIVRQALRAALRMEEGWGPPTVLRDSLLGATGAATANDLMHRFYTAEWPRSRVATLAKYVDAAAGDGDEAARAIIDSAAGAQAMFAGAVRDQLFRSDEPARLAYIGGVFRSERLLRVFRAQVLAAYPATRFGPPQYGPAAGALLEAYRLAGLAPQLTNLPESEK